MIRPSRLICVSKADGRLLFDGDNLRVAVAAACQSTSYVPKALHRQKRIEYFRKPFLITSRLRGVITNIHEVFFPL